MRGEQLQFGTPDHGTMVVVFTLGLALGVVMGGIAAMGGKRNRNLRGKGIAGEHAYVRIAIAAIGTVKNGVWDDLSTDWQTKILVAVVDAEPRGAQAMNEAAWEAYRYLLKCRQLTCSEDD